MIGIRCHIMKTKRNILSRKWGKYYGETGRGKKGVCASDRMRSKGHAFAVDRQKICFCGQQNHKSTSTSAHLQAQARNYPRPHFEYQTPQKIEIPGSVLKCSRAAAHTAAQPRVSKKRFWASQTEPVLKKEPRAPTSIVSVFFADPKTSLFSAPEPKTLVFLQQKHIAWCQKIYVHRNFPWKCPLLRRVCASVS